MLTQVIEACHSLINRYIFPNGRPNCRGSSGKEDCDTFMLGHLVVGMHTKQTIPLWPGDPEAVAGRLNTKNLLELYEDTKGIHEYMEPDVGIPKYLSAGHASTHQMCRCTPALLEAVRTMVFGKKEFKVLESEETHLQAQREKLIPSKIIESNFRRRGNLRVV